MKASRLCSECSARVCTREVDVSDDLFSYVVDLANALAVAGKDDGSCVNAAAVFFEDDARSVDAECYFLES
ncbi:hypothetical protein [Caballeronia sp. GAWG2-1]|uniref:hypothetical protein n=1 Tax=Caballeronia sp. GAWG2-1 TaxID=2921744 RepID=UPI0020280875|nr:hypothetical protein [Caballeronia sp. GAWG2-1]